MKKRTSAFARILAALALAGAVVVVIVVDLQLARRLRLLDASSGNGNGGQSQQETAPKTTAKTYVVKSGDTLISIAHQTGVPVAHILALNPEVDPQILIAGETLKLR